jgi:hypothetical protein
MWWAGAILVICRTAITITGRATGIVNLESVNKVR